MEDGLGNFNPSPSERYMPKFHNNQSGSIVKKKPLVCDEGGFRLPILHMILPPTSLSLYPTNLFSVIQVFLCTKFAAILPHTTCTHHAYTCTIIRNPALSLSPYHRRSKHSPNPIPLSQNPHSSSLPRYCLTSFLST